MLKYCDEKFFLKINVFLLFVGYEGEERLPCDVCGKTFGALRSLRYHYAVHMGRTECEICGRIMSRVSHLKTHLLTVHGLQMYRTDRFPTF
jgi:hypothetical protein